MKFGRRLIFAPDIKKAFMKKLLCCLLLAPASVYAQKFEFGLGAGLSISTKPSDNMAFKTDRSVVNAAGALSLLYNINAHLQTGLEMHLLQLSGKSDAVYTTFDGRKIGGDDKKFVYGKSTYSFTAVLNGKKFMGNGYGYAGVAAGYVATRHDSKTLSSNESYRAPNGGNGLALGLQLGYVRGISKRLAVNAELAMRYFNLGYDAMEPSGTSQDKLKYSIMAFPVTVGIRYQLFTSETKEKDRQDLMNQGSEE